MKKLSILCVVILANLGFISCSPESMEGLLTPSTQEHLATDGEEGKIDPPDLPPGGN